MENNLLHNNLLENYNDNNDNRYIYSYICLGFFFAFLIYFIIKDIII
jgi:hypothetical protein